MSAYHPIKNLSNKQITLIHLMSKRVSNTEHIGTGLKQKLMHFVQKTGGFLNTPLIATVLGSVIAGGFTLSAARISIQHVNDQDKAMLRKALEISETQVKNSDQTLTALQERLKESLAENQRQQAELKQQQKELEQCRIDHRILQREIEKMSEKKTSWF